MQKKLVNGWVFFGALLSLNIAFSNDCQISDIQAADQNWQRMLNTNQVEKITSLYDQNATLLPTFDSQPLTTPEQKSQYFQELYKKGKVTVHFDQEFPTAFPGGGTSSGLYTFTITNADKTDYVPARFTFFYKKTAQGCQLIAHHSSALPKA